MSLISIKVHNDYHEDYKGLPLARPLNKLRIHVNVSILQLLQMTIEKDETYVLKMHYQRLIVLNQFLFHTINLI